MSDPTPQNTARETSANEFSAAFPPQFTILGVKLLPLSIGRYRLMKWAEIAFVSETEATASMEDLFTAIVICGMRCEDFKRLLAAGKLEKELRGWKKKLNKGIKKEAGFNIFEKFKLFQHYIKQGQELPWIALPVQNDGIKDSTHTHWSNVVEVVLRGELGWTKEEIEEEPLTKALCDYFKHMENQGCVKLMPHDLYEQMIEEGRKNQEAFDKMAGRASKEAICPV